jgi:hypothetical protein
MPRALLAAALACLVIAAPTAASPVLVYDDGHVTKADDPALPPASADPPPADLHQCGGVTPRQAGDSIRLLPPFDPYILGWKDRSFAIAEDMRRRVMPGGGMFRAVVLVNGRVTGTWSRAGGRVTVDAPLDGLDAEVADVERFLEDGA